MMQRLAGISERRWWNKGTTFVDGAAMAGAKAMAEAGVQPGQIGLMINTSVSRAHLEPSTAIAVHHQLGLPSSCHNFDVTNACLGFVNGMQLASAMIDSGQIDYALIVNGEDAEELHEATIARLEERAATAKHVFDNFASLTLGSGAAAMVLGRADLHPEGHRYLGGATRSASQHNELCVGDMDDMRTDSTGLMNAGIELTLEMWGESAAEFGWEHGIDRYIIHQVSNVHTKAIAKVLDIDTDLDPADLPDPRQPRAGGHPADPGQRLRRAVRGGPGAADGYRVGAQRLDLRDRLVTRRPFRPRSRTAPATLPPPGLPGLDPAWSRLVDIVDADGIPRTFHVLDAGDPRGPRRHAAVRARQPDLELPLAPAAGRTAGGLAGRRHGPPRDGVLGAAADRPHAGPAGRRPRAADRRARHHRTGGDRRPRLGRHPVAGLGGPAPRPAPRRGAHQHRRAPAGDRRRGRC